METILNYTFRKPFYRQSDFLELFSLSLSTLKRYIEEWRSKGGDPSDMGKLNIQGYKEVCWNPQLFLQWLIENKVELEVKYNHEALEVEKSKQRISDLSINENNIKPFKPNKAERKVQ